MRAREKIAPRKNTCRGRSQRASTGASSGTSTQNHTNLHGACCALTRILHMLFIEKRVFQHKYSAFHFRPQVWALPCAWEKDRDGERAQSQTTDCCIPLSPLERCKASACPAYGSGVSASGHPIAGEICSWSPPRSASHRSGKQRESHSDTASGTHTPARDLPDVRRVGIDRRGAR